MSHLRQAAEPEAVVRSLALGLASGFVIDEHAHGWDQLVHAARGVLQVDTAAGSWVVPPQRAVWVPAGTRHRVEASGAVDMRTIYLPPGWAAGAPTGCCVVDVPPLLRELVLTAVERGALPDGPLPRLIAELLETLPSAPLRLPAPSDPRARRVAEVLRQAPSSKATVAELVRGTGASQRTVERLFREETGMGVGRWRQQMRLLEALRQLAAGGSVTEVALEVGYDSTSAFVSMFRRALGTTPGRYFQRT
jgi:AraC-like DNA-binding protein